MSNRKPRKPSRKQAEEAIHTLLLWAGEDPRREGLIDTPKASCPRLRGLV